MKNKDSNYSERPWGRYFVLHENSGYKVKRIEVNPKARLSYQYHKKRSETWVIIHGEAIVTIEGKNKNISKSESESDKRTRVIMRRCFRPVGVKEAPRACSIDCKSMKINAFINT